MSLADQLAPHPLSQGLERVSVPTLTGANTYRFNVADLLDAAKKLNDLADRARNDGWTVEFVTADYVAVDVAKSQKGNGA